MEDVKTRQKRTILPRCQPGDCWQLGKHRLICGDSRDQSMVDALMGGDEADLCFTSPPYNKQRTYNLEEYDWTDLMNEVFSSLRMKADGQVIVNLGLVHRNNEVVEYWADWVQAMRQSGWRRFGWYVWYQGEGLQGNWNGRLAPCYEFLFHFNKQSRQPNKILPCKYAGSLLHGSMRKKDASLVAQTQAGKPVQPFKIPNAVVRIEREKRHGVHSTHPAVFPVELPRFTMETYTQVGEIVYDPFCGSGSTILAGEESGRFVYGMEIDPSYCDIVLARWEEMGRPVEYVGTVL